MQCHSSLASGPPEDAAMLARPPAAAGPRRSSVAPGVGLGGQPESRQRRGPSARSRPLAALPKAHLHLHFTGSMRHGTLVELAHEHGIRLPAALTEDWPPRLSAADE